MATNKHHPKHLVADKTNTDALTHDDLVEAAVEFLQEQALLQPFCRDKMSCRDRRCSCLSIFLKEENVAEYPIAEAVGRFMIYFAGRAKVEQQIMFIEWMKYTDAHDPTLYRIPAMSYTSDAADALVVQTLKKARICASALLTIIGYGKAFYRTCQIFEQKGEVPCHALAGRPSNHQLPQDCQNDLFFFFDDLEELTEPRATRFVKEKSGELTTRDDNDELVYLPPSMSKRGIYQRYAFKRGWRITTNNKGNISKHERTDDAWKESGETGAAFICSYGSFLNYWNAEFPHIRSGNPSADICGECHKFANRMKYKGTGATPRTSMEPSSDVVTVDPDSLDDENVIENARKHVVAARMMREYANKKTKEALDDELNEVPWSKRHDCIVGDYCQNMELPYFGKSQPGDTYYFSPRGIYCFGVTNVGAVNHKLNAYIYMEGEGKKGGNNVASLLDKDLKRRGWIDPSRGPRKELSIILDNCGGQNKNRMVLRYALLMAELHYYRSVNVIFLVAGHTKNSCDRLFNALKVKYRLSDIFTIDMLVDTLASTPFVTPIRVTTEDFKDFDGFEDRIYKRLATGSVNRSHVFRVDADEKGVLRANDTSGGASFGTVQYLKKGSDAMRDALLTNIDAELQFIVAPGLAKIKQVELFTKYRPFIPVQYRDELCPDPGEDVVREIKEQRNKKQKMYAEKQKKGAANTKKRTADRLEAVEAAEALVRAALESTDGAAGKSDSALI